jgi:hypothetical protein
MDHPYRVAVLAGIIGNDMWFDHELTFADFMAAIQQCSRRSLLDRADNSPMLVINGAKIGLALGGHLESLTPEEMQRRYTALFQK